MGATASNSLSTWLIPVLSIWYRDYFMSVIFCTSAVSLNYSNRHFWLLRDDQAIGLRGRNVYRTDYLAGLM